MRSMGVVLAVALVAIAFAGCTEPSRDLETEAKQREDWARKHNDHDPVGILSGPATIAPGALVWFSAHGSHDPDFFGARDDARREAGQEAGFHATSDAGSVEWAWHGHLDEGQGPGLGNGVRSYEWRIDDGPALVAPELTHRYGSEDGPIRFPVGFPEEGNHTLTLTVLGWDGGTDSVTMDFEVAEGGTPSTIPGWSVTEEGWTHERTVPVSFEQYGDCPPIGRSLYQADLHRLNVPWDLYFFSQAFEIEATWEEFIASHGPTRSTEPSPVALGSPATLHQPPYVDPNLNDVAVSLGHCETGDVWQVFDVDQAIVGDELTEGGSVTGEELAEHAEMTGAKTERRAAWDFNVYLSDRGTTQWGSGGDIDVRMSFTPATDTGYGGL